MKMSFAIAMLFFVVMATLYFVLQPDSPVERGSEQVSNGQDRTMEQGAQSRAEPAADIAAKQGKISEEKHRLEMQAAFLKLQQSRKQLKSRVNYLKSKIWGLKLPAEQAAMVRNKMLQVYAYLKNPSLLGAYFEVADIRLEAEKVDAMQEELQKVEQIISRSQNSKDK